MYSVIFLTSMTFSFTDKMIVNETLKDVPLLLLANKQDLEVGNYGEDDQNLSCRKSE